MNDPLEILMNEHKEVLGIVDDISSNLKTFQDSPAETTPQLKELIEKLDSEFDVHSLKKEEQGLFPVMETFLPRDEGPIGVMIGEHEELVKRFQVFKEGLNEGDHDKVMDAGSYITSTLRDHIYKEDNILYNIARMHLSSEDMQKVYDKLMEIAKEYQS